MSFELLKQLSEAHGISGREDEVRAVIRAELNAMGLEPEEDALGNLLVHGAGAEGSPPILLDAHTDEIGLIVQYLHPNGAISFATVGGWDARTLVAHPVTIRTPATEGRIRGVIGSKPPHIAKGEEAKSAWAVDSLWIDIGSKSAAETADLGVRVGDPVVLDGPCEQIRPGLIRGKALDDRVGCYVILETIRSLMDREIPVALWGAFTTSEEVGTRGVKSLAFREDWKFALHLEATVAADVPGVPAPLCPTRFGEGPALTVMDNSFIVPERMLNFLEGVAGEKGIAVQRKAPSFGGTNAGSLHQSGRGFLCGVIAAPCRYIHSPVTLLRESDLAAMITLTREAVLAAQRIIDPE